ncbi:IS200/IS605 family transposase [Candidatus Micrarchaeota archaeon CG_4_10_14_0_2_um_filter_49_7]|nr:MAG: IS200/IS605 family transposase [Candidatus Micrarchaeota archaeon CG_4_10_14_0_2_um_filter_49_7]
MASGGFVRGNHSVGINAFHLEWCPKYRFDVLGGDLLRQVLRESILKTAADYGMQVLATEISLDHIHLFVNLPPTLSVSFTLQLFKGRSSRDIFRECPSFRKLYRKGHFWSRGSFYRSVSNVGADTVYRYITEHRSKELGETVESARKEAEQLSLLSFV